MTSWDTPAVPSPTTANYAAPLVDFSKIANLPKDYYAAQEIKRQDEKATLFRNGIPRDSTGEPDFNKITDTAARVGGIDYAMPLLSLQAQRAAGLAGANAIAPQGVGGPAAQPSAAPQPPPSGQPRPQPASAPQPAQQPTVMTILAAQGIPNDQLGAASASLARQLGVDPTEPIDTNDPQVRNVLGPAIQRLKGVGQPVAQAATPDQPPVPASSPASVPPAPDAAAPGMDAATADRLTGEASFIRAKAAGLAALNPKVSEVLGKEADQRDARAKQIRDYLSEEDKSTPDQKNYNSDHLPGESMTDYQSRAAAGAEAGKQDSIAYGKKYEGIQKAAVEASIEQPKIQLMKQFANDPNFYSGPLEPTNRGFKQFAATIGADPNKALPQEGFNKVASDMLTSQIRALGASGAGPVRIAEVKNMQKSIANLGITPVTNRLLVEITDRTYNDVKAIADLTRKYETNPKNLPGKKNVGLDTAIQDYYDKHPIFSDAEKNDPRLIAPPEFKTARDAFNAKFPKGQPVKIDGKMKWVQ